MAESQISARASSALVATVGAGGIAALLGIYSCVSFANHQLSLGADDERGVIWPGEVALIDGRALAIAALVFATLLFTSLAGFTLLARGRREVRLLVLGLALLDAAVLVAILASSWSYGWKYILDHNAARPFVGMAILQAIAFLAAGVLAMLPSAEVVEEDRPQTSRSSEPSEAKPAKAAAETKAATAKAGDGAKATAEMKPAAAKAGDGAKAVETKPAKPDDSTAGAGAKAAVETKLAKTDDREKTKSAASKNEESDDKEA